MFEQRRPHEAERAAPAKPARRGVGLGSAFHRGFDRGIEQMVAVVSPTLGPMHRSVAVDRGARNKSPEILDSAGLIARRVIELSHPTEDVGAMYARGLIWRVHDEVGDGAATAAVLFAALHRGARRHTAAGIAPMLLRDAIVRAGGVVREELRRMAIEPTGPAILRGMIASACYDEEIAAELAHVFDVLPSYGRLDVRMSNRRETRHELVAGSYWDVGVHSIALLDPPTQSRTDMVEPAILVSDFQIDNPVDLAPVITAARATGAGGLLIVCRSLSSQAGGALVTNAKSGEFPIVAVRVPGFSQADQLAAMGDLALLTGAKLLLGAAGDRLKAVTSDDLGYARSAWATRDLFGISSGGGEAAVVRREFDRLMAISRQEDDRKIRDQVLGRLGVFSGGSATLWVSAATEAETKRRISLAERGALVVRQAMQDGVVPGGGVALLSCQAALVERIASAIDEVERAGLQIVHDALQAPAVTMLKNAGYNPGPILNDIRSAGLPAGFDIVAGTMADLHERGIVDAASVVDRVVMTTIESASLAITIDGVIHTDKREASVDPEGKGT